MRRERRLGDELGDERTCEIACEIDDGEELA